MGAGKWQMILCQLPASLLFYSFKDFFILTFTATYSGLN
jgi:hypothetical protein